MAQQHGRTVVNHFNTLAPGYLGKADNRRTYLDAVDGLVTSKLKELPTEARCLDLGCGVGDRLTKYRAEPGNRFFAGLDISRGMLSQGQTDHGLADTVEADMAAPPFRNESFSLITSLFFAFCYLPTNELRQAASLAIYDLLTPGGIFIVDLFNRDHQGEGIEGGFSITPDQIIERRHKSLGSSRLDSDDHEYYVDVDGKRVRGYHHFFTHRTAQTLFSEAGFEIKEAFVVGYETGTRRNNMTEGNFVFVMQKPTPSLGAPNDWPGKHSLLPPGEAIRKSEIRNGR